MGGYSILLNTVLVPVFDIIYFWANIALFQSFICWNLYCIYYFILWMLMGQTIVCRVKRWSKVKLVEKLESKSWIFFKSLLNLRILNMKYSCFHGQVKSVRCKLLAVRQKSALCLLVLVYSKCRYFSFKCPIFRPHSIETKDLCTALLYSHIFAGQTDVLVFIKQAMEK